MKVQKERLNNNLFPPSLEGFQGKVQVTPQDQIRRVEKTPPMNILLQDITMSVRSIVVQNVQGDVHTLEGFLDKDTCNSFKGTTSNLMRIPS